MVIEIIKRRIHNGCSATEALKDVYAVEYMLDNYQAMKRRVLELIGDTPEHRQLVDHNLVHANFLDELDTSEGRRYPDWLRDNPSIDQFLE